MPARDGCEPQMIRAFENDGWTFFALAENQSFLGIMQIDFVVINLQREEIVKWNLWKIS